MAEIKNIPELRFPEFNEKWEKDLFGDIASFSKGKGISKADIIEDGEIECIRYGELYTTYNEVIDEVKSKTNIPVGDLILSERNDVIIPASGETQIDIARASCVVRAGIALGGDLNIIKTKLNGIYLAYYLNNAKKKEIAGLAQGISVVHLYSGQLKTLSINYPKPNEQEKIATFLTAIDKRISLLTQQKEQLERYKKGLMQKIFSRELRFKDNNGKDFPEWEEKKLGEIGTFVSGVGFSSSEQGGCTGTPFFKVSDMNLKGNEFEMKSANHFVNNEQIKRLSYKPIKESSIIFAKVGAAIFLERKRIASNFLIDNNMMSFTPKGNIQFFKYLLDNIKLSKLAQTGALPSYNATDLKTIKIKLPSIEEQDKIASLLAGIEKQIENMTVQLVESIKFKTGLYQKIFV